MKNNAYIERGADFVDMERVSAIIDALESKPGALLPMLHAIQDEFGFIPSEAVPLLARALRQTAAEISGVISFYHHFRTSAPGGHVLQLCRAEACQAVGGRSLEAYAKQTLGIDYHQTSADGLVSLEPVYCLGNCACGPSLRLDDDVVGRVTTARFDQLLDELRTQTVELVG